MKFEKSSVSTVTLQGFQADGLQQQLLSLDRNVSPTRPRPAPAYRIGALFGPSLSRLSQRFEATETQGRFQFYGGEGRSCDGEGPGASTAISRQERVGSRQEGSDAIKGHGGEEVCF